MDDSSKYSVKECLKNAHRIHRSKFRSKLLNGRFQIGAFLDEGAQSRVYEVKDMYDPDMPLVIKVSPNFNGIFNEI